MSVSRVQLLQVSQRRHSKKLPVFVGQRVYEKNVLYTSFRSTTLLPTLSAADANSFEIVSSIELAMSSKTPFLNCENRIDDTHEIRIRQTAR
jgi:hypothetical protein